MTKIIGAFEVVDHGWENSQYFQGCGTSFTAYNDIATGCGSSQRDALDDSLESLAQNGWEVEDLHNYLASVYKGTESQEGEDWHYYLSVRVADITNCNLTYEDGCLKVSL